MNKWIVFAVSAVALAVLAAGAWLKRSPAGAPELLWVDAETLHVGVGLSPAAPQVGENRLWVQLRDADGQVPSEADIKAWAEMPAMGSMPAMRAQARLRPVARGQWQGELELPMRGEWPLTVVVDAGDGRQARLGFDLATGRAGLELVSGGRRLSPASVAEGATAFADELAGNFRIGVRWLDEVPAVGENRLRVTVRDRDGAPVTDARLRAVARMAQMPDMGAVTVEDFESVADGVFVGRLSLPMAGEWLLSVDAENETLGHADRVLRLVTGEPGLVPVSATPEGVAWYTCPMHPSVRSPEQGSCPICGMTLQPVTHSQQQLGGIRLDAQRRQLIGVKTAPVQRRRLWREIRALGIVAVDESRLTDVSLKFDGWIGELRANATGQAVGAGEVLFTVYGPDLLTAQQEYLEAVRRQPSGALAAAARSRLRLFDVPDAVIDEIARRGRAREFVPVHAPVSGVVIDKPAVAGSVMRAGSRVLRIADLSTVWVEVDVYEQDLDWLDAGTPVRLSLPNLPGESIEARIDFVYPTLDMRSRTGRVRLAVPNPEGRLKPGMYAEARLTARFGERLVVPESAVIFAGDARVVFVDAGDGRLIPRRVRLGLRGEDGIEVLEGLAAGESVVTSGNFLIASEARLKTGVQSW